VCLRSTAITGRCLRGAARRAGWKICAKTLKSLIWRKEGEARRPSCWWHGLRFSARRAHLRAKERLFPPANAAISPAAITAPEECGHSSGTPEMAAFTNPLRSDFVEPNRAKNCEQPPVHSRSRDKLIGALDCAQACGLHEVVSHVPRSCQHERISPKARERGLQPSPHFQSARFAHGPARVHRPLY
jgi:hypothetical protein